MIALFDLERNLTPYLGRGKQMTFADFERGFGRASFDAAMGTPPKCLMVRGASLFAQRPVPLLLRRTSVFGVEQ